MKYKVRKAKKFQGKGIKGWSVDEKDLKRLFSVDYIEISTKVSKRKSKKCDRIYYVIKGVAIFTIGDKKQEVKEGEYMLIPKNTIYSYKPKTKIKVIEINTPPYDMKSEVFYEEKK